GSTKAFDAALLILGKATDLQQAMNKQPQTGLGRQPPGGGVRRVEQPGLLEIGHDVADRCRRQVLPEAARQGTRADRLAGGDVAVDDHAKNFAAALVEFVNRRWCGGLRHASVASKKPIPAGTPAPAAIDL